MIGLAAAFCGQIVCAQQMNDAFEKTLEGIPEEVAGRMREDRKKVMHDQYIELRDECRHQEIVSALRKSGGISTGEAILGGFLLGSILR